MPSSNGVYSLPAGYLAVTGATIQASQHNPPLEDIAAALTARLSRDGTAAMSGAIQFAPGTVNVPGAVFSTDLSSGFYKTTSGIGVAIGGVKIAEFLAGGLIGARFIGELIAYTCIAAPALTVMPFGQTLNRITYAALWAQAQIEIAAGSTLYNNGDGSTTFGIMDVRGRIPVAWDKMGGTASGRLTTAGSGVDGTTLGSAGGSQTYTILRTDLPNVAPTFSGISSPLVVDSFNATLLSGSSGSGFSSGGAYPAASGGSMTGHVVPQGTVQSLNGGVTQTLTNNMPPVLVTNYLLFAGA
jgi:microcystin-dependent protein